MDIDTIWCACHIQNTIECITGSQPSFWYNPNKTIEKDREASMTSIAEKNKGCGLLISVGRYAGFHIWGGWALRICLGWICFTFFPVDGDVIVELASRGAETSSRGSGQIK